MNRNQLIEAESRDASKRRPFITNAFSLRRSRLRVPELLVGSAIVVACVVISLLVNASGDGGSPVLVANGRIPKGSIIDAADLGVISVEADAPLALLAPGLASEVVGLRATVDIESGAPLSAGLVTGLDPLGTNEALFGLVVTPSQAPIELAAGDRVAVVAVDQSFDSVVSGVMVTPSAEVWSISEPDPSTAERTVTLRVPIQLVESLVGRETLTLSKVVQ